MTNKKFLTLEEAKEKALYTCEYQKNVYYYEIEHTSHLGVLIENGKVWRLYTYFPFFLLTYTLNYCKIRVR